MLKRRSLCRTFCKKYRKRLNFFLRSRFETRTFFATDVFKSASGVGLSLRQQRLFASFNASF